MKHGRAIGLVGMLLMLGSVRAEEAFSRAIRPEDFAAAELGKLSPEALARLDELVQAYKSGAVATARAEAEARAAQVAAAQEKERAQERERAKEQAKAASPGFLAKAKVLLTPGTKVEYAEVESELVGDLVGWDAHTVFTLKNGQRWRVANGDWYSTPAIPHPKVRIIPAALGSYWMTFEGIKTRVKVLLVSA